MTWNPVIFREYDIRGVYQTDYDESFARILGQAYGTLIQTQFGAGALVTVGYDARLSSPSLSDSLIDGLCSTGCNVLTLGLITSPISYFSTFSVPNVVGAVMITGSHNPPEYNGFKISVGNSTIYGEQIQDLRVRIEAGNFLTGNGTKKPYDVFPAYIEKYKKEFSGLKAIPIVLDCGNGAAGCIVRKLYEATGLKPKILFEKPDGLFPNHHPDPTVEKNLKDLVKEVKATNSVVGIGFDGDADRIGVVDHTGHFLLGDELMTLVSRDILSRSPGAKIVGDVKCSDRLYADIKKHRGEPIMWKTGHSLIKQKIKEERAPFGGELSGHIFFADRNYGYDDALYAGLRLVEILSKTGKTIPELLEGLPSAFNTPEIRIDTTEEKKHLAVKKLISYFETDTSCKMNLLDGVRISFDGGWALARASNTQPVLVLRFEARSQKLLNEIQQKFNSVLDKIL